MLITRAQLLDGTPVDVRVGATIAEVGSLKARPGEDVLDAAGGTVIPGLHDHHVHLWSAAAALASVDVGPPAVRTAEQMRVALHAAASGRDGWIRAVGYHDSVAGPLDRVVLDELSPRWPVRVQHRSGALWTLNTEALIRIGAPDHPDGRLFRADAGLPRTERPPIGELSRRLAARGVTGITDATPGYAQPDVERFERARQSGELRQRLHCMAVAGTTPTALVSIGPAKMILDDTTLDLDALTSWVADNHATGHPVAVHAVTDSQLVVSIAALRDAGVLPGDRIEHAAVVPDDCIGDLADLGITVVTQPNFVAERGDEYRAEVPAVQHRDLWRVASLIDAGVPVALSTDAPFGDADPWASMRAAVRRRTLSGAILGAAEQIPPEAALRGFLGRPERPAEPRRVAPGEPGDLCVLSGSPEQVLAELDAGLVSATVIGGEVV
ncbi:MAG: amidohydrolase family protein [Mycobacterium sp.]|nr:amidohydrolase family protein [Mycobacterium sp.]